MCAQVSCNDPDQLCTSDPCVVNDVVVVSPCTVDFGARQLIIRGTVGVPDAGTLDFTAATITVEGGGGIDGRHSLSGGNGASISLHASGDIDLAGSLDASGFETAGSITVEAAGLLTVDGSTRANLIGRILSTAGQIALRGADGVTVERTVEARGTYGGSIEISSSAGDATVNGRLRATTKSAFQPAMVTVMAYSNATVNADIVVPEAGTILVSTVVGDVTVARRLRANSQFSRGGMVTLTAGGALALPGDVTVRGYNGGGSIQLTAEGR